MVAIAIRTRTGQETRQNKDPESHSLSFPLDRTLPPLSLSLSLSLSLFLSLSSSDRCHHSVHASRGSRRHSRCTIKHVVGVGWNRFVIGIERTHLCAEIHVGPRSDYGENTYGKREGAAIPRRDRNFSATNSPGAQRRARSRRRERERGGGGREKEIVSQKASRTVVRPDVKSGLISPASRHLVSSIAYQAGSSSHLPLLLSSPFSLSLSLSLSLPFLSSFPIFPSSGRQSFLCLSASSALTSHQGCSCF